MKLKTTQKKQNSAEQLAKLPSKYIGLIFFKCVNLGLKNKNLNPQFNVAKYIISP